MSNYSEDYVNALKQEIARSEAEREALVQEFSRDIAQREYSPDDLKKKFAELLPTAYERMIYLLNNATSEAVQLSVAKYIFNVAIGHIKITAENDPDGDLKELLGALVTNKPEGA